MAITVNQGLSAFNAVYNPVVVNIISTNVNQANFRYVLDLYPNGGSTYIRMKKAPYPGSADSEKVGIFDVAKIMEAYVGSDISDTTYGFKLNANSYATAILKFGEEYGASSGIVVYPDLTVTASAAFYAAGMERKAFIDSDFINSHQIGVGVGAKRFLSKAPLSQPIFDDENAWLYLIASTHNDADYMQIKTYDADDVLIQTVNVDNNLAAGNQFARFSSGTRNLNLISSGDITLGAQPIITDTVASYTVQLFHLDNTATSETKTYVITDNCSRFASYRVHFLNQLGGFDSFTFNGINKESVEQTRTSYRPVTGTTTATTFTYSKSEAEEVTLNVNYRDSVIMESDWIDEDAFTWLEELFTSPEAYIDDTTHGLLPINLTKTKIDRKNHANDKLLNIIIEGKLSATSNRQRG